MKLLDRALFKFLKIERSYSQSGEDKILRHLFNNRKQETITYLDIGTNHPVVSNNTFLFYRTGSRGVCVEPNPRFANLIRRYRPRDVCLDIGLGTNGASVADFYVMSAHTLSTFSKDDAEELDRLGTYTIESVMQVPLRDVNSVVADHFTRPPDLVSVDAEGWSEEIVRSFDFARSRPACFCVETITFSESGDGRKIDGIFEVFENNEYGVYADTRINTIFVDRHL
jgi:FkbM family methyltransferase